jgi:hypothetical protein
VEQIIRRDGRSHQVLIGVSGALNELPFFVLDGSPEVDHLFGGLDCGPSNTAAVDLLQGQVLTDDRIRSDAGILPEFARLRAPCGMVA